jgi:hypothetical protein
MPRVTIDHAACRGDPSGNRTTTARKDTGLSPSAPNGIIKHAATDERPIDLLAPWAFGTNPAPLPRQPRMRPTLVALGGGTATPPPAAKKPKMGPPASPLLEFADIVSYFVPPPLYERYARMISDIGRLPGVTLDDALGLFVCQLWTTKAALVGDAARWFGVRQEDVANCRDRVLDYWDVWESLWDVDAYSQLIDGPSVAAPTPPARAANFTRMARQCRYTVWVPAFPNGNAYVATLFARRRLTNADRLPQYATVLACQISKLLEELQLNALIGQGVRDLLTVFYRRHIRGRVRVHALAEETLAAVEEALRAGSTGGEGGLWLRPFPEWVRSIALRVMLAKSRAGGESPRAILDRLRPHLEDVVDSATLAVVDLVSDATSATTMRSASVGDRRVNRAVAIARRRIERRVFLPAGLKPVASYAEQTLTTAARHGRLAAVRFLHRWYTTDWAVGNYLPKQEPRSVMKHGFRAIVTLSPYAYFVALNRFEHLLVREQNRVFIDEELWWHINEDLDLDRPVIGQDLLLRFAMSQYDYRRLLAAAKTGRLEAVYQTASAGVGNYAGTGNSVQIGDGSTDRDHGRLALSQRVVAPEPDGPMARGGSTAPSGSAPG